MYTALRLEQRRAAARKERPGNWQKRTDDLAC
jgi:hypothetical protein